MSRRPGSEDPKVSARAAGDRSVLRGDLRVISVVAFVHCVSHFFQLVIPPIFPWLMREFSLSFTAAGTLASVFFAVSGVGQAISGFLVDRFGARPLLYCGLWLIGASAVLLAAAQSVYTLALASAVAGLGNAVFHPADYATLNRRVSLPRLGQAFSVHAVSGMLGWVAAPVFMFGLANAFAWRVAALAAAAVALSALALVWVSGAVRESSCSQEAADARAGQGPTQPGALAFLGIRDVWLCFSFLVCMALAVSAVQNFAPSVLDRAYGIPLALATYAVSAYALGSAAGTLAGGFVVSALAPDRGVLLALLAGSLLALLLASGVVPSFGMVSLMAAMGFAMGVALPSRDLMVRRVAMRVVGEGAYGRIYGVVYCGLDVGLAVAPFLFGWLMDTSQFPQVLVCVALFQAMAILVALRVAGSLATR